MLKCWIAGGHRPPLQWPDLSTFGLSSITFARFRLGTNGPNMAEDGPAAGKSTDMKELTIATPASREETIRRLIMLIALYAIPAVLALGPINDPDLFWHLRTGQWIVAHGTLPTTDPFSAYGIGKPWIVYSWLWEVLIYDVYRWLGLTGILIYRMVMSVAVTGGLHYLVAKREPRFAVALGIVALAMVGIAPGLTERPWLFTIIFVTLTLDTVLDCLDGKRTKMYWLLPIIYVLWA